MPKTTEEIVKEIEKMTKEAVAPLCNTYIGPRKVAMVTAWALFKYARDKYKTFGDAIRQAWKWIHEVCKPWKVTPTIVPPEKIKEIVEKYMRERLMYIGK